MGIKPMGRNSVKPSLSPSLIGHCTECKQGIFAGDEHVRVRRPTIGLNHKGCVPAGAVVSR